MPRHNIQRESSDEGPEPSPAEVEPSLLEAAQKMVGKTKQRRTQQRDIITREYDDRVEALQKNVDDYFDSRQRRGIEAQDEVWNRLEALNQKRKHIEKLIFCSTRSLESATLKFNSEVLSTLQTSTQEAGHVGAQGGAEGDGLGGKV
ncbi:unnamed protein product [Blumeria hordei]|uniref:Uncharacterized protein n=1 Tax=Blumeria hordei TaxID=2867405 RepID=A0A383UHW4_BLUHO|nr:unnamed protein product [Blumeria hordei]